MEAMESASRSASASPATKKAPARAKSGPLYARPAKEQNQRINIALDAAKVGQYTRLKETIVETVKSITDEEVGKFGKGTKASRDDQWNARTGLAQNNLVRSNFYQVIHEAAALGRMRKDKPVITTNVGEAHTERENEASTRTRSSQRTLPLMGSDKVPIKQAISMLVENFVEEQKERKFEELFSAEAQFGRIESLESSRSNLLLLSPVVPGAIRGKKRTLNPIQLTATNTQVSPENITPKLIRKQVSEEAVLSANDRNRRILQCQTLRVTTRCTCGYCDNPSPYQTHYYRQLEKLGDDRKQEAAKSAQQLSMAPLPFPTSPGLSLSPDGKPNSTRSALSNEPIPLEEGSEEQSYDGSSAAEQSHSSTSTSQSNKCQLDEQESHSMEIVESIQHQGTTHSIVVTSPNIEKEDDNEEDEMALNSLSPDTGAQGASDVASEETIQHRHTNPDDLDEPYMEVVQYGLNDETQNSGNNNEECDRESSSGMGSSESTHHSPPEENVPGDNDGDTTRTDDQMPSLANVSDSDGSLSSAHLNVWGGASYNHMSATWSSARFSSSDSQLFGLAEESENDISEQSSSQVLQPQRKLSSGSRRHPNLLDNEEDSQLAIETRKGDATPKTPTRRGSNDFDILSSSWEQLAALSPSEAHSSQNSKDIAKPVFDTDKVELDHLMQQQENGETVDENRLYELQLYDWEANGWALTPEEQADLKTFRELRKQGKQPTPNETSVSQRRFSSKTDGPLDNTMHDEESTKSDEPDPSKRENMPKVDGSLRQFPGNSDSDDDTDNMNSFQVSESTYDETIQGSAHEPHVLSKFLQNQMEEMMLEDDEMQSRATFRTEEQSIVRDLYEPHRPIGRVEGLVKTPITRNSSRKNVAVFLDGSAETQTHEMTLTSQKGQSASESSSASQSKAEVEDDSSSSLAKSSVSSSPSDSELMAHTSDLLSAANHTVDASNDQLDTAEDSHAEATPEEAAIQLQISSNTTTSRTSNNDKQPSGEGNSNPLSEGTATAIQTLPDSPQSPPQPEKLSSENLHSLEPIEDSEPSTPQASPTNHMEEGSRALESAHSHETIASSLPTGDTVTSSSMNSREQRRREDEDLDELNDLYDRRDAGEDIDENRLYELELFDRSRQGETLSAEELEDLEFYKRRRRRVERHVKEFNRLCDEQDAGKEVDQDRLYFLELVVRDRLGASLTEAEMQDLETFEAEEEDRELEELNNADDESSEHADNEVSSDNIVNRNDSVARESESAVFQKDDSSLSSGELDELNEMLDRFEEGKEVDKQRMRELDIFERWKNGEVLDALDNFELQIYRKKRRRERSYRREFQELLRQKERGEDMNEYRLNCLALLARQSIGEELDEGEWEMLEEFQRRERSLEAALEVKETKREGSGLLSVSRQLTQSSEKSKAEEVEGDREEPDDDLEPWASGEEELANTVPNESREFSRHNEASESHLDPPQGKSTPPQHESCSLRAQPMDEHDKSSDVRVCDDPESIALILGSTKRSFSSAEPFEASAGMSRDEGSDGISNAKLADQDSDLANKCFDTLNTFASGAALANDSVDDSLSGGSGSERCGNEYSHYSDDLVADERYALEQVTIDSPEISDPWAETMDVLKGASSSNPSLSSTEKERTLPLLSSDSHDFVGPIDSFTEAPNQQNISTEEFSQSDGLQAQLCAGEHHIIENGDLVSVETDQHPPFDPHCRGISDPWGVSFQEADPYQKAVDDGGNSAPHGGKGHMERVQTGSFSDDESLHKSSGEVSSRSSEGDLSSGSIEDNGMERHNVAEAVQSSSTDEPELDSSSYGSRNRTSSSEHSERMDLTTEETTHNPFEEFAASAFPEVSDPWEDAVPVLNVSTKETNKVDVNNEEPDKVAPTSFVDDQGSWNGEVENRITIGAEIQSPDDQSTGSWSEVSREKYNEDTGGENGDNLGRDELNTSEANENPFERIPDSASSREISEQCPEPLPIGGKRSSEVEVEGSRHLSTVAKVVPGGVISADGLALEGQEDHVSDIPPLDQRRNPAAYSCAQETGKGISECDNSTGIDNLEMKESNFGEYSAFQTPCAFQEISDPWSDNLQDVRQPFLGQNSSNTGNEGSELFDPWAYSIEGLKEPQGSPGVKATKSELLSPLSPDHSQVSPQELANVVENTMKLGATLSIDDRSVGRSFDSSGSHKSEIEPNNSDRENDLNKNMKEVFPATPPINDKRVELECGATGDTKTIDGRKQLAYSLAISSRPSEGDLSSGSIEDTGMERHNVAEAVQSSSTDEPELDSSSYGSRNRTSSSEHSERMDLTTEETTHNPFEEFAASAFPEVSDPWEDAVPVMSVSTEETNKVDVNNGEPDKVAPTSFVDDQGSWNGEVENRITIGAEVQSPDDQSTGSWSEVSREKYNEDTIGENGDNLGRDELNTSEANENPFERIPDSASSREILEQCPEPVKGEWQNLHEAERHVSHDSMSTSRDLETEAETFVISRDRSESSSASQSKAEVEDDSSSSLAKSSASSSPSDPELMAHTSDLPSSANHTVDASNDQLDTAEDSHAEATPEAAATQLQISSNTTTSRTSSNDKQPSGEGNSNPLSEGTATAIQTLPDSPQSPPQPEKLSSENLHSLEPIEDSEPSTPQASPTNHMEEGSRALESAHSHETIASSLPTGDTVTSSSMNSREQRRREDEDLDELNDLYDRRDAGEDIDENRLYELELFDRSRQGETLSAEELEDLEFYKRRRRRVERHVKEFNRLCDEQDAGKEVDQDRLYFLELVVRDRLGASLTEAEMQDLETFEAEEEDRELEELNNADDESSEHADNEVFSDNIVNRNDSVARESESAVSQKDDSSLSSGELDELNEMLDRFEAGKEVDKQRMRELDIFERWKNGEVLDALDNFELQIYRKKRRRERSYRREFQELLRQKERGEDMNEYRLNCLALLARQSIGEELDEGEWEMLEEFQRRERSLEAALEVKETKREGSGLLSVSRQLTQSSEKSKAEEVEGDREGSDDDLEPWAPGEEELANAVPNESREFFRHNEASESQLDPLQGKPTSMTKPQDEACVTERKTQSDGLDMVAESSQHAGGTTIHSDCETLSYTTNAHQRGPSDCDASQLHAGISNVVAGVDKSMSSPTSEVFLGGHGTTIQAAEDMSSTDSYGFHEREPLNDYASLLPQHNLILDDDLKAQSILGTEILPGKATVLSFSNDSGLTSVEKDELIALTNRYEAGEDVDEDRLYELDLLNRWQQQEELAVDEARQLDALRLKRRQSEGVMGTSEEKEEILPEPVSRSIVNLDSKVLSELRTESSESSNYPSDSTHRLSLDKNEMKEEAKPESPSRRTSQEQEEEAWAAIASVAEEIRLEGELRKNVKPLRPTDGIVESESAGGEGNTGKVSSSFEPINSLAEEFCEVTEPTKATALDNSSGRALNAAECQVVLSTKNNLRPEDEPCESFEFENSTQASYPTVSAPSLKGAQGGLESPQKRDVNFFSGLTFGFFSALRSEKQDAPVFTESAKRELKSLDAVANEKVLHESLESPTLAEGTDRINVGANLHDTVQDRYDKGFTMLKDEDLDLAAPPPHEGPKVSQVESNDRVQLYGVQTKQNLASALEATESATMKLSLPTSTEVFPREGAEVAKNTTPNVNKVAKTVSAIGTHGDRSCGSAVHPVPGLDLEPAVLQELETGNKSKDSSVDADNINEARERSEQLSPSLPHEADDVSRKRTAALARQRAEKRIAEEEARLLAEEKALRIVAERAAFKEAERLKAETKRRKAELSDRKELSLGGDESYESFVAHSDVLPQVFQDSVDKTTPQKDQERRANTPKHQRGVIKDTVVSPDGKNELAPVQSGGAESVLAVAPPTSLSEVLREEKTDPENESALNQVGGILDTEKKIEQQALVREQRGEQGSTYNWDDLVHQELKELQVVQESLGSHEMEMTGTSLQTARQEATNSVPDFTSGAIQRESKGNAVRYDVKRRQENYPWRKVLAEKKVSSITISDELRARSTTVSEVVHSEEDDSADDCVLGLKQGGTERVAEGGTDEAYPFERQVAPNSEHVERRELGPKETPLQGTEANMRFKVETSKEKSAPEDLKDYENSNTPAMNPAENGEDKVQEPSHTANESSYKVESVSGWETSALVQEINFPQRETELASAESIRYTELQRKKARLKSQKEKREAEKRGNNATKILRNGASPLVVAECDNDTVAESTDDEHVPVRVVVESRGAEVRKNVANDQNHRVNTQERMVPTKEHSSCDSKAQNAKSQSSRSKQRSRLKIAIWPKLDWRSDPKESFSDWTVRVRPLGTKETINYHIHRNVVGYGPRKSGFLAKQFLAHEHGAEQVSRLLLPPIEADIFGMVLDYIYLSKGKSHPTLSADSACAMYKLGERLEIPTLQATLAEFYRKNLNIPNMGKFLRAANRHRAERLAFVAKARIGSIITADPKSARLLKPKFVAELGNILAANRLLVMRHVHHHHPETFKSMEMAQSKRWSLAIYHCSLAKGNTLTEDLFSRLTHEKVLPAVDPTVALAFLNLNAKFKGGDNSLEYRCTSAILHGWKIFTREFETEESMMDALQGLPKRVLSRILVFARSQSTGKDLAILEKSNLIGVR